MKKNQNLKCLIALQQGHFKTAGLTTRILFRIPLCSSRFGFVVPFDADNRCAIAARIVSPTGNRRMPTPHHRSTLRRRQSGKRKSSASHIGLHWHQITYAPAARQRYTQDETRKPVQMQSGRAGYGEGKLLYKRAPLSRKGCRIRTRQTVHGDPFHCSDVIVTAKPWDARNEEKRCADDGITDDRFHKSGITDGNSSVFPASQCNCERCKR